MFAGIIPKNSAGKARVVHFCIQNLTANSTCKKDTVLTEPAQISTDIPADFTKAKVAAKKEQCAYLRKYYKSIHVESDHIKDLKFIINKLKLDIEGKGCEIMAATKVINKLKEYLERKEREIIEEE